MNFEVTCEKFVAWIQTGEGFSFLWLLDLFDMKERKHWLFHLRLKQAVLSKTVWTQRLHGRLKSYKNGERTERERWQTHFNMQTKVGENSSPRRHAGVKHKPPSKLDRGRCIIKRAVIWSPFSPRPSQPLLALSRASQSGVRRGQEWPVNGRGQGPRRARETFPVPELKNHRSSEASILWNGFSSKWSLTGGVCVLSLKLSHSDLQ